MKEKLKLHLSKLSELQKKSNGKDLPILLAIVMVVFFLSIAPIPKDDLLRDLIAWKYNYNYSNLYIHAPLVPLYNQYILFDKILGFICQHSNLMIGLRVVQLSAIVLFCFPMYLIAIKLLSNRKDRYPIATLVVSITFCACGNRILIARPEVFFAAWLIWGCLANIYGSRGLKTIWLLIGTLITCTYWLSFIYIPAALIVFSKNRNKILGFMILSVSTIIQWQYASNGLWIQSQSLLHETLLNRIDGLNVGENATILLAFIYFPVGICTFFLGRSAFVKIKNKIYHNSPFNWTLWSYYVLICWFTLSNMVRYVDVIFPLELIILIYLYKDSFVDCAAHWVRSLLFIISIYCIAITYLNANTTYAKFNLPENSKVITNFTGPNYWLPFFNDKKIKIAPAMDIGMSDKDVQLINHDLTTKQTIDCVRLKQLDFDYLAENQMNKIPSCLKIEQIYGGYRLWKIIKN